MMDAKREASQKIAELRQEDNVTRHADLGTLAAALPSAANASQDAPAPSVRLKNGSTITLDKSQPYEPIMGIEAPSSTFDLTVAINECITIGEVSALVKEAATKLSKADFEVIQKCAEERNRQLRMK